MSGPKRNYQTVDVLVSAGNFAILLDGTQAKIGTAVLQLPTRALADAIAREWRAQEKKLHPECMRLTRLAGGALSRVSTQRGEVIARILSYGRNEPLCYRAVEPPELTARQKALWDPLLEWIHVRHNIRLVADCGISFIEQPADALVRMHEIVSARDDFELAALDATATVTSSFVVALALIERRLDAAEAFALSHLDELFQAEKWGHDPEADTRRTRIAAELGAVERFVSLLD